jgi:hypothetical protein
MVRTHKWAYTAIQENYIAFKKSDGMHLRCIKYSLRSILARNNTTYIYSDR